MPIKPSTLARHCTHGWAGGQVRQPSILRETPPQITTISEHDQWVAADLRDRQLAAAAPEWR
jgi:hypothetical protein